MPTNNPHHWLTLPVELNYQILEETWRLPLSTADRRGLLVTLPLVCTSFRCIATRLFLQDAHVVSPAYATHFLSLLQQQREGPANPDPNADGPLSSVDTPHSSSTSCCCCRSITFHIYDPTSPPDHLHLNIPSSNPTTHALETTLRALSRDASLAPALRRLALHYAANCSFTHELSHARFAHLPPHVRTLELRFATPALFASHLRQIYPTPRHHALPMPGVRSLSIFGTCPAFVTDVARACPALESLETDVPGEEVLALQPSLRPFLAVGVTHGDGDGDGVRAKEGTVVVGHEKTSRDEEWGGGVRAKYQTRMRAWKRGARGDA
ncbi:hypothetical protein BC827DRAFT_1197157 [Russula dissimulans]|nr:hypothetical protein BC827DRAFT_1197157 [Russula dissimulans]